MNTQRAFDSTTFAATMLKELQISLHQCKAAYHILSKRLQKAQAYICLMQESWFVWTSSLYTRAAVFIRGMQCRVVTGFVTRDLVALQIKIGESGDALHTFHRTLGQHLPLKNSRN